MYENLCTAINWMIMVKPIQMMMMMMEFSQTHAHTTSGQKKKRDGQREWKGRSRYVMFHITLAAEYQVQTIESPG